MTQETAKKDHHSLAGKVAIVTGAGNGIGSACGRALSSRGASVCLADVDLPAAQQVAQEIEAQGGKALAVEADVTSKSSVQSMVSACLDKFGSVDILANVAGGTFFLGERRHLYFIETEEEDWQKVLDVNLKGTLLCCKMVLPEMIKNQRGSIINISSRSAFEGSEHLAVYSASKGAVLTFTKALAKEVLRYGVRVNTVAPAVTMTRQITKQWLEDRLKRDPIGKPAEPDDIAQSVAFLASDESRYLSGQVIQVSLWP